MNTTEFNRRWPDLHPTLKQICRIQIIPTVSKEVKERNAIYMTGFLRGLIDTNKIDFGHYDWAMDLVNTVHKFEYTADLVRGQSNN